MNENAQSESNSTYGRSGRTEQEAGKRQEALATTVHTKSTSTKYTSRRYYKARV